jgi:hypothetical protein
MVVASWPVLSNLIADQNRAFKGYSFRLEYLSDLVLIKLLISNFYSVRRGDFAPIGNIYQALGPNEFLFHIHFVRLLQDYPAILSTNNDHLTYEKCVKSNPENESLIAGLQYPNDNLMYMDSITSLIEHFRWRIMIDKFDLLEIKNDKYSFEVSPETLARFWQDLVFDDCVNFLKSKIQSVTGGPGIVSHEVSDFIKKLTSIYSASQIFGLVDKGLKYSYDGLVKSQNYRGNLGMAWKESIERYINSSNINGWEIKGVKRPLGHPASVMHDVYFKQILMLNKDPFAHKASSENARIFNKNLGIIFEDWGTDQVNF